MRKLAISMVLLLAAVAQAQRGTDQAQTKVIQDPAEYNAYMTAINLDPAQKAVALESFIQKYPASIMKSDALELLLAAYNDSKNQSMMEQTAGRILAGDPTNLRALAVATSLERAQGTPQSIADAGANAQKGLQALANWTKPEGMTDADFKNFKDQMAALFDGASAFAALQSKDYATAREHYLKSLERDPNSLENTYQLAVAELETTPIDLDGFWYGAKAIRLAAGNPDTLDAIAHYVKVKYKSYHGNVDDWDKFAATVAAQTAPPANMAELIPRAPTQCELAVRAVKDNKPEDLSLGDWEFILSKANCSPANKEAASIIWQTILDKQKPPEGPAVKSKSKQKASPGPRPMIKLPAVLVLSATAKTVEVAATLENQCAKKADLAVTLEKPVLHPPASGATIDVVGTMTAYRAEPFLFTMERAALHAAKPATLNCDQLRAGTF